MNASGTESIASRHFDVIVVGGGIVGCGITAALAAAGHEVLLLEARQGTVNRFSGELIHPPGVAQLERSGLLDVMRRSGGTEVQGFHVLGVPEAPTVQSLLPYADIPGTLPFGFAIHHPTMVDALRAALVGRPRITVRSGVKVVGVEREGGSEVRPGNGHGGASALDASGYRNGHAGSASNGLAAPSVVTGGRVTGVRTNGGETLRARLVVAADGRHSQVRDFLGLPTVWQRHLSFTAGVLLPDGYDCLPRPGFAHIFLGAWGPILAYPISRREVRICCDLPVDVPKGSAAITARLLAEYVPHMPPALAEAAREALEREPPEMAANYYMSTDHCATEGAVLVGDAAGCIHPLTASGMTVGLNDARILASLPSFELDSLREYERQRYEFVRLREILADALYEVFGGHDEATRAIRRGILAYWNRDPAGRSKSMGLLACAGPGLGSFLEEYLTVVRFSMMEIARDPHPLLGRLGSFWGLGKKSYEKLDLVTRALKERVATRRSLSALWSKPT